MNIRSLITGLAALVLLAGCQAQPQPEPQPEPAPATAELTLYFYSESDLQNATFDRPIAVTRSISSTSNAAEASVRLLLAGPTAEESARGARTSEDMLTLASHILGVETSGDTAIVNFTADALPIVNGAAAQQFMVKEPIRRTLLQFPEIQDVEYAIDGEVFDEWDA